MTEIFPPEPLPTGLPPLGDDVLAHSAALASVLHERIFAAGGWLSFEDWMDLALYAPGLGYYTAGNIKLAQAGDSPAHGDFITAPELTPWFGATLAGPVASILAASDSGDVLELGAGSGALADSVLTALAAEGRDDVRYAILEVSPDLRARQQARLARWGERVQWLDTLPEAFSGCILANEVLDAMPVQVFRWHPDGGLRERGVASQDGQFVWAERPAPAALLDAVSKRMPPLPGYGSEVNLRAEALVRGLGQWLQRGAAIFIDYGFPRHEYYHPQRASGTLMCHLRHTAHANPLCFPGIQDITAHVDFTAMADAALDGGLDVLAYTAQARFLLDAGLLARVEAQLPTDPAARQLELGAVQQLLSEAEMGELFKVLIVGRDIDADLPPSPRGDRRDRL